MHRCHVEPEAWTQGARITLGPDESHHVAHVLRLTPGAEVLAFDGDGYSAPAHIETIGRGGVTLLRQAEPVFKPRPRPCITLLQAIPKGSHMDLIVEKTTELGVACIQPIITDRVVKRPGGEPEVRWRRIALAAAKQCGTPWLPAIRPILHLTDALKNLAPADALLIGSLEPDARPLRDVLRPLGARNPATLALLIGPEGDFSPAEYQEARKAGATPISLGPLVLRVETAAIAGVSILRYECADA